MVSIRLVHFCLLLIANSLFVLTHAQTLSKKTVFTRQDSLRGGLTPTRVWWDVLHYDVQVTPDHQTKTIKGKTTIKYKVVQDQHSDYLQVDLQQPLKIEEIYYNNKLYINYPAKPYYNEGNAWFIPLPKAPANSVQSISLVYSGRPREATMPPWDGGWIWKKDKQGSPWMSVACQGLGASAWYPCKDYQGDEPDEGAALTISVPETMVAVGNGRLTNKTTKDGLTAYTWEVRNPINNYNIIPYIGNYVKWNDTLMGEKGRLDIEYWVLEQDLEKAKKQFEQVKPTLRAFEYWFGPYPFYEDGYKLVQAPHLGMEHQSAVAYGNQFENGYLGGDMSGSGWGKKFDYIIVHETGHEWFGNNITTVDIADMWVHEGFTDYSETLFVEYYYGQKAANEYVQGLRKNINNDAPIIGPYGVNREGSGDMYYKGANLIHTIRQLIDDDEKFRDILRGLNSTFYHQTVTSRQVEDYIINKSGKDLGKVFDQYLRTSKVPVLEYKLIGSDRIDYRWANTVPGFNMPVRLAVSQEWLKPTTQWKIATGTKELLDDFKVDPNFYVEVRKSK